MARHIQDALLRVVTALPAAAANNDSDAIDLEQVSADTINEKFELQIKVPALPALVEAKKLTITVQDSADNESFAAVPELATLVITGESGNGADAAERTVRLPSTARRYIRINQAVESGGGSNIAVKTTLQLLF